MCFQACPHFCVWKWWVSLTHIINVPVWVPRAVKRHTKGPDRTVSLLAVTSGSSNRQSDVSEAEITVARWAQSVSTNLLAFLCDHRKQRWSCGRRTAAASSKLLTSHWLEGTMKFYFSSNFMDVTETGSLKLRTGSVIHSDTLTWFTTGTEPVRNLPITLIVPSAPCWSPTGPLGAAGGLGPSL